MPVWPANVDVQFPDAQLLSTRNVSPGRVTDFVFGGLNYQVEHHLFPSMPRSHFAAARMLVKAFCADNDLPYAECGARSVYRIVLAELPRIRRAELV
jgi:fatty acid desaturase